MVDTAKILWELLTNDDGGTFYALVGPRVWSSVAQAKWTNTQAAVVFSVNSESAHLTAGEPVSIVVFKCYGGSGLDRDAAAVYRALCDRLHGLRGVDTASGRIHVASLVTATQGQKESDTNYPFVAATFEISFSG